MAAPEIGVKVSLDASGLKKGADLASGSIAELRQIIKGLKQDLINTGADNPKGIQSLKNELRSATSELKILEKQAGVSGAATGNAFTKAYSGLKQIAYILPGIGIAGLLGIIATGITSIAEEIFNYASASEAAAQNQNKLNVAIGEAQAKTEGEIANINSLVGIAGDETLSREARTQALKQLNKEYPNYFTNADLDKTTTEQLKTATDKLTSSILLNAKAKAIQGEIDKSAAKIASAQNDENADLLSTLDKLKAGFTGLVFGFGAGQVKAADLAIQKYNDIVKEETANQENLAKQLDLTNKQLAAQGSLFTGKTKPTKDTSASDLSKQISEINKEISALENLQKQGVATGADIAKLFSLRIEKFDLELPKSGLTDSQADRIRQKLESDLTSALEKRNLVAIIKPDFSIDTSKALQSSIAAGKGTAEVVKDGLITGIQVGTKDITKEINNLLQGAVVNGIVDFAGAIGNAFSGGGFDSIIKSVGTIIGQFIIDLGKILIQSGIEIKAIQEAIKSLAISPLASVAIGIAAIAIGTIIKNASSQSKTRQKGFKEGGISDGPQSGYFALLHGKEVITPYAQAARMLGGGDGGNMTVSGVLRAEGRDLVAVIKSATKINKRLGG